jgi:predicted Zn-dependent protease
LKLAQTDPDFAQVASQFATAERLLGAPDAESTAAHVELASARAELALRRQQPEAALTYLRRARKLAPENLQLLFQESEALRRAGRVPEAQRLMAEYEERSALANALFQMTERVKQDPKNPSLRLKMARLFARNKDTARAINQYEYCLYLDPLDADAKRELNALKR